MALLSLVCHNGVRIRSSHSLCRAGLWRGNGAPIVKRVSVGQAPLKIVEGESLITRGSGDSVASRPASGETLERRHVTVMFCDLVGSTELSERLDPEDYAEVIRAYRAVCSRYIDNADGSIDKFMGDGILARFGYPIAHEDDAIRACSAGLGIIETVARQDPHLKLQVRVACATGLVLVGELSSGTVSESGALMGATPNLAARLQGLAGPGTLVISDETRALIGALFETEDLGFHELKGFSQPVRAWRVARERQHESRFAARQAGAVLEMVDREDAQRVLSNKWTLTKSSSGQSVSIVGEPGIGKSRLIYALRAQIQQEPSVHLFLQCSAFHQSAALYPVIDFLGRVALRLERDDSAKQKIEKLEGWLSERGLDVAETAPLLAHLLLIPSDGRYPPLVLSPEREKQLTLDGLVRSILSYARKDPVLFVTEDLHWADPTTLQLFGLLRERLSGAAVMAVFTYRPEFKPEWAEARAASELSLDRLDSRSSHDLVMRIAGGRALPAELRDQIVGKTDGVPLFVEELTKTVQRFGAASGPGGRFELARPLPNFEMPATLNESLAARLDQVGKPKATAQKCAVLGREFSYALFRSVFSPDSDDLLPDLEQLVAAELLYRTGDTNDRTYSFKHALVQEAAYNSLPRRTRQEHHARVAQVLLGQAPDAATSRPETIAQHYTRGGLPALAIPFWVQAGQSAMQRSANLEAISDLNMALELLAGLPPSVERDHQEAGLRVLLAVPLTLTRGWAAPEVGAAYHRAAELLGEGTAAPNLFPALVGVLTYYLVRGQYGAAYEMGARNRQIAERSGDADFLIESEVDQGTTAYYLGRFDECLAHLNRVDELYDPVRHHGHVFAYGKEPGVVALIHKSGALWNLGYPDQGLQAARAAKALMREWSHPFTDLWASVGLAFAYQVASDAEAMAAIGQEIIEQSIEQVFPNWLAQGMVYRGWGVARLGEQDQGIEQMRQGLDLWNRTGAELFKTYLMSLLADGLIHAGRSSEAVETLDAAFAQVERTDERFWEAELLRQRGEAFMNSRRPNEAMAEEAFRKALEAARGRRQRAIELRAATSLARLWGSRGQVDEALAVLRPILSSFGEGLSSHDLNVAKKMLESLAPDVAGAGW
jgi:class 3 adenylate cyclase/predicted ATPase